jgi:flagellar hook-associated protein 3 FlgL
MDAEELTLDQVAGVLSRAKELGLSQASSPADAQTRLITKPEVDQLLKAAVSLGNTQHVGEFLFGGDQSMTAPFQGTTAPYSSAPPTGTRRAEISTAMYVKTNHNGTEVFLDTGTLAALEELSTALGANDPAAIQTSLLSIDRAMQGIQTLQGDVGAQRSQLEMTSANLTALDTTLSTFKSTLEDEDVQKAITELVGRQTAYQAAMLATSRVIGLNLADYLR